MGVWIITTIARLRDDMGNDQGIDLGKNCSFDVKDNSLTESNINGISGV